MWSPQIDVVVGTTPDLTTDYSTYSEDTAEPFHGSLTSPIAGPSPHRFKPASTPLSTRKSGINKLRDSWSKILADDGSGAPTLDNAASLRNRLAGRRRPVPVSPSGRSLASPSSSRAGRQSPGGPATPTTTATPVTTISPSPSRRRPLNRVKSAPSHRRPRRRQQRSSSVLSVAHSLEARSAIVMGDGAVVSPSPPGRRPTVRAGSKIAPAFPPKDLMSPGERQRNNRPGGRPLSSSSSRRRASAAAAAATAPSPIAMARARSVALADAGADQRPENMPSAGSSASASAAAAAAAAPPPTSASAMPRRISQASIAAVERQVSQLQSMQSQAQSPSQSQVLPSATASQVDGLSTVTVTADPSPSFMPVFCRTGTAHIDPGALPDAYRLQDPQLYHQRAAQAAGRASVQHETVIPAEFHQFEVAPLPPQDESIRPHAQYDGTTKMWRYRVWPSHTTNPGRHDFAQVRAWLHAVIRSLHARLPGPETWQQVEFALRYAFMESLRLMALHRPSLAELTWHLWVGERRVETRIGQGADMDCEALREHTRGLLELRNRLRTKRETQRARTTRIRRRVSKVERTQERLKELLPGESGLDPAGGPSAKTSISKTRLLRGFFLNSSAASGGDGVAGAVAGAFSLPPSRSDTPRSEHSFTVEGRGVDSELYSFLLKKAKDTDFDDLLDEVADSSDSDWRLSDYDGADSDDTLESFRTETVTVTATDSLSLGESGFEERGPDEDGDSLAGGEHELVDMPSLQSTDTTSRQLSTFVKGVEATRRFSLMAGMRPTAVGTAATSAQHDAETVFPMERPVYLSDTDSLSLSDDSSSQEESVDEPGPLPDSVSIVDRRAQRAERRAVKLANLQQEVLRLRKALADGTATIEELRYGKPKDHPLRSMHTQTTITVDPDYEGGS